jgi:hypothetical protein
MCAFEARADLDMDYFVGSAKAEKERPGGELKGVSYRGVVYMA